MTCVYTSKHSTHTNQLSSFLPEVNLSLDEPGPGDGEYSVHHVRKWVSEGHHSLVQLVRHNGVFICDLLDTCVLVKLENPLKLTLKYL